MLHMNVELDEKLCREKKTEGYYFLFSYFIIIKVTHAHHKNI